MSAWSLASTEHMKIEIVLIWSLFHVIYQLTHAQISIAIWQASMILCKIIINKCILTEWWWIFLAAV